ncbi:MAG: hypothetical protein ACPIOQ_01760 [Promethearchaeia archaeon]
MHAGDGGGWEAEAGRAAKTGASRPGAALGDDGRLHADFHQHRQGDGDRQGWCSDRFSGLSRDEGGDGGLRRDAGTPGVQSLPPGGAPDDPGQHFGF